MAAFPKRPDHATRAILGAIEALRSAGRPVTIEAICEITGRERGPTSSVIVRLRRIGRLPCRIERSPSRGSAYLRVVAAAEQLEREGGALTWDRIGRVAGCSAKAAHGHANNAEAAGLWRWTVVSKWSLMSPEERLEWGRSIQAGRDYKNGWVSEEKCAPMDMAVLEEIRASKVEAERSAVAEREVDVRVCKYYSPHARHYT